MGTQSIESAMATIFSLCAGLGVSVCLGASWMLEKVNKGVLPNICHEYLYIHINTVTVLHMLGPVALWSF